MIAQIQKLFNEQNVVSLYNLSLRFGVEAGAMEQMLEVLVKKGRLTRREIKKPEGHCGKCTGNCHGPKEVLYERIGER